MIKYETIISNFEDKTTLYNWLRKVEEALKYASATNFVVNKKGNATLSFSITFADGTTLESGDIVLQQGESVDDARIAGGVLQLHLTNGTWLTAGNLGAVSYFSIDASQHLIVHYQDGSVNDLGAIFSGNINISGDLNVTGTATCNAVYSNGSVSGSEIIERMSGYGFLVTDIKENFNINVTYASVVKTGNKITFVWAYEISRTGAVDGNFNRLGNLYIPQDIGAKLVPYTLGWSNDIIASVEVSVYSGLTTKVTTNQHLMKGNNGYLFLVCFNLDSLTENTTYIGRTEITFLLSDSLAQ